MEKRDLKKLLAGVSIASLVAVGVTTVATVQKASAAWSGSKGAGSTQTMPVEATIMTINGKAVKNAAEIQAQLDTLAVGAKVAIAYKSKGADRVIEGVVK